MKQALTRLQKIVLDWFVNLTLREKQLIVGVAAILTALCVYLTAGTVSSKFMEINSDLESAGQELTQVSNLLSQYSKVKAQRDWIENEFRSVEFKEGELTYLEELIRRKLGLSGGFSITPRGVTKFGSNYEQHLFTVKFTLNDLKLVMEFLNDIVSGPQPLLLTRLDIRVTRNGEALDVDMDVSSIKQART